ncbi:hypothetical protein [Ramlibacter sp.]|uniref:hypothetical protein n=1 Tax=Ramlibacter sp. TaxID=1917967 RepID=UPI003D0C4FC2
MRVIYTRAIFWADGFTVSPQLVLIHPRRQGDAALIEHERVHCDQMRRFGAATFWWRYATNRAFRLLMEVEGYQKEIAGGRSIESCARALSSRLYMLGLTESQIREQLAKKEPS